VYQSGGHAGQWLAQPGLPGFASVSARCGEFRRLREWDGAATTSDGVFGAV
jgi:hypothetical protein